MPHHEVDLLLSCGCIAIEQIEAAIFLPSSGEARHCIKHKQDVIITRVGQPYWVEDEQTEAEKPKPTKKK